MEKITSMDLIENYAALILAIRNKYTPERAFRNVDKLLDGKKVTKNKKFNEEEAREMFELLKKGYSYKLISELFSVSRGYVQYRIMKYENSINSLSKREII